MNPIKRNPVLAGLAAFVAASALSIPGALALGQSSTPAADNDGPVTPRRVVASGTDAAFGRWELVVSRTAKGELCRGIRLLDADNYPGEPTLAEGCGGDAIGTHLGSLTGANNQALLFGRLPAGTSSVAVATPGGATLRRQVGKDADGEPFYVGRVTADAAQIQSLAVTAATPAGDRRVDSNAG